MFLFPIPFGVSLAATVRVGNLMGAGHGRQGRTVMKMTFLITMVVMACTCTTLYINRQRLPLMYTDDPQVIEASVKLIYVFLISAGAGGMCQSLRGILNGCGMQAVNARVSMFAGYCIGLPLSFLFCYGLRVDEVEYVTPRYVYGLWIGLAASNLARLLGFIIVMYRVDWDELARKAQLKAQALSPRSGERDKAGDSLLGGGSKGATDEPKTPERQQEIKDIIAINDIIASEMKGMDLSKKETAVSPQTPENSQVRSVSSWTVGEVGAWLQRPDVDFPHYARTFREKQVDGFMLAKFEEADLEDLVTDRQDRRQIIVKVRRAKAEMGEGPLSSARKDYGKVLGSDRDD